MLKDVVEFWLNRHPSQYKGKIFCFEFVERVLELSLLLFQSVSKLQSFKVITENQMAFF
jgi:hypothetical protein